MKTKLKDFLQNTQLLLDDERKLWEKALPLFDEKSAADILVALQDENDLRFLTANLKTKIEALGEKDLGKWSRVLLEENAYLHSQFDKE